MNKAALLLFAALCAGVALGQGTGRGGVPGGAQPQTAPAFFPRTIIAGPYVNYFDDYLTTANVSSGSAIAGGTGSCATSTTYLDNTSPGNISMTGTSGAGGTGFACVETGGAFQLFDAATAPPWVYETRVQFAALPGTTGASYQAGLTHAYTVSPWVTGIGFYLSSSNANANHWYCEYGSSPTLTDSTISAVVSTWTRLSIYDDGTNVHWYVNGVEATACKTAVSSMPTLALYMAYSAVPSGATTVTMGIDYLAFQMQVAR